MKMTKPKKIKIVLSEKKIPSLPIGRYRDNDDNRGLYLQITENGASWLLRYDVECAPRMTNPRVGEKSGMHKDGTPRETTRRERWLGLGSLRDFSLKEARIRARAARQLLSDGVDPLDVKQAARQVKAVAAAKTVTFEKAKRKLLSSSAAR
jgi:hypothetical protein